MQLRQIRQLPGLGPQRSDMQRGRTREGERSIVVVGLVAARRRRACLQALAELGMPGRCLLVDRIRWVYRRRVLVFGVCSGASGTARA